MSPTQPFYGVVNYPDGGPWRSTAHSLRPEKEVRRVPWERIKNSLGELRLRHISHRGGYKRQLHWVDASGRWSRGFGKPAYWPGPSSCTSRSLPTSSRPGGAPSRARTATSTIVCRNRSRSTRCGDGSIDSSWGRASLLSGGELLLHPGLAEVVRSIRLCAAIATVITDGRWHFEET